jgi:hypothetical protein
MSDQRFDFGAQLFIAAAGFIEKGRAFGGVALKRRSEDAANFLPTLRFHNFQF